MCKRLFQNYIWSKLYASHKALKKTSSKLNVTERQASDGRLRQTWIGIFQRADFNEQILISKLSSKFWRHPPNSKWWSKFQLQNYEDILQIQYDRKAGFRGQTWTDRLQWADLNLKIIINILKVFSKFKMVIKI